MRQTRSVAACLGALKRAAAMVAPGGSVTLKSDRKTTYPKHARRAFKVRTVHHLRTPSVLPWDKHNPLFPINHEEACCRDRISRLRPQDQQHEYHPAQ